MILGLFLMLGRYSIAFPLFAFYGAIPLGTLRIRGRQIFWLGIRHTAAAVGAVALGLLFGLLLGWAYFWSYTALNLVLFAVVPGVLSGWFAFGLQRWAEGDQAETRAPHNRWNPRHWGALGHVGSDIMVLAGLIVVRIWTFRGPRAGPNAIADLFVFIMAASLFMLGLACLVAELSWKQTART